VWSLQNRADPTGGLQISYQGGDEGRSSTFIHVCDERQVSPPVVATGARQDPQHKMNWILILQSAHACPVVRGGVPTLMLAGAGLGALRWGG
jgi:hypothetical protein